MMTGDKDAGLAVGNRRLLERNLGTVKLLVESTGLGDNDFQVFSGVTTHNEQFPSYGLVIIAPASGEGVMAILNGVLFAPACEEGCSRVASQQPHGHAAKERTQGEHREPDSPAQMIDNKAHGLDGDKG